MLVNKAATAANPKIWSCPNCVAAARTVDSKLPMHPCPGLAGLMVPLVPAGLKCKVEAREREDYVGKEMVQTNPEGRPIMSVVTTRDDGMDCRVLVPCALAERE